MGEIGRYSFILLDMVRCWWVVVCQWVLLCLLILLGVGSTVLVAWRMLWVGLGCFGWLVGWVGWLVGWSAHWLFGCLVDELVFGGCLLGFHTRVKYCSEQFSLWAVFGWALLPDPVITTPAPAGIIVQAALGRHPLYRLFGQGRAATTSWPHFHTISLLGGSAPTSAGRYHCAGKCSSVPGGSFVRVLPQAIPRGDGNHIALRLWMGRTTETSVDSDEA